MLTVVILGAGELGATLARILAGRELVRRIVLADPDFGKARGKALDILQSGPVDRFDTQVEGAADARSVFVYDPNGIRVQLMAKEDKGA